MDISFVQRRETYLSEARYEKPKQVFRMLGDQLERAGLREGSSLLDVGCATGELVYYLRSRFSGVRFSGVDNQPELLARAAAEPLLSDIRFIEADALTYRGEKHDVSVCFGMLGIFDDFEPLFESLIANTHAGGRIYVHGLMNDDDIDVRIYYRDNLYNEAWNRGFNIVSAARLQRWLSSRASSIRFTAVELETDLPKRPETPHRAYTAMMADGRRITTNGLCLRLPEKILEIVL